MLLVVVVWKEEVVCVEVALEDLEARLVCDAVSVAQGRCTRDVVAGHVIECAEAGGGRWGQRMGRRAAEGVVVVRPRPVRRILAENAFGPATTVQPRVVWYVNSACTRHHGRFLTLNLIIGASH